MVGWFFAPPGNGGVGPTGVCCNGWLVPLLHLIRVGWDPQGYVVMVDWLVPLLHLIMVGWDMMGWDPQGYVVMFAFFLCST